MSSWRIARWMGRWGPKSERRRKIERKIERVGKSDRMTGEAGSEGFLLERERERKIRIIESLITFHEKKRPRSSAQSSRRVNRGLSVEYRGS